MQFSNMSKLKDELDVVVCFLLSTDPLKRLK